VLQIGILLGATQAFTALGFGLVGVEVVAVFRFLPPLLTELFYPLSFGLFVGGCGGLGFGFGLGGFLCFFALYFRVFGCVPRVKDLLFWECVLADANSRAHWILRDV